MIIKRASNERGMAAVIFVTITFGLLGFLAIYFDLSSYVAAKSTVDAAANAVMRCLIPTDADCVRYTIKEEPSPPPEWMGYEPGGPREVIVWRDDKGYSGSMNQKAWGAEYTTYESNWAQRQVQYDTYSVPIKEFKAVYSRYRERDELPEVPFTKTVVHYSPTHLGKQHFPVFERDESSSWASWIARHPLYTTTEDPDSVIVQAGNVRMITRLIEIPKLEVEPEDASCLDNNQEACDVSSLAGGSGDSDTWKHTAYLSIKAFAEIRGVGGKGVAKWGREEEDPFQRAGLWIDILDESGRKLRTECLGGRVSSEQVGEDRWKGYNLWTRGPAGAHGGSNKDAVCPGGDNSHDNIAVPRGGRVAIRAYLKAHKDRSAIEANVRFAWFFDNYEPHSDTEYKTATCNPVFLPGEMESECIKAEHCGLSSEWKISRCQKEFLRDFTKTTCEPTHKSVEFLPPEPRFSYRVPVCNNNWHIDSHNIVKNAPQRFPEVFSELKRDSEIAKVNLIICGWEEVKTKTKTKTKTNISVGSVPDSCPSALHEQVIYTCQDAPVGTVNEIDDCNGISSIKSKLQQNVKSVNNMYKTLPNKIVFPEEVEFSWGSDENNRWVDSWTPLVYNGGVISGDSARVKKDNKLQNETHFIRAFERDVLPIWKEPSPRDFLAAIKSKGGNKKGNWDDYVKHSSQNVRVMDQGENKVNITSAYPFNKPTPEIYWGQRVFPPKYDFDLDGEEDVECRTPYEKFESLEGMLRNYASSVYPEAIEKHGGNYVYKFNAAETHREIRLLGVVTEKKDRQVEKCIPTYTKKNPSAGKNDKLVSLGRSVDSPVGCNDGTYFGCYPVSAGEGATLGELIKDTDYETAILAGVAEMRAVFPQAHYADKCEDSDKRCYSIEVDDRESDRMKVLVRYNVPLEFPFNKLIQSDTIAAYSLKDEIEQIATIR